jgi:hypothetical protein
VSAITSARTIAIGFFIIESSCFFSTNLFSCLPVSLTTHDFTI